MEKNDDASVKFSQDNVLRYRKSRDIIAVEKTDWERIIGMIEKYSKLSILWWTVFSFCLSLAVQFIITYSSIDIRSDLRTLYLILFAMALTASICTLIFALMQKSTESVKKEDIINEMKRVKNSLNEEIQSE